MVIIIMPSLILTKWDVEDAVYVPAGVVSNLQNYHLAGIRFLYDCYQNRLKGGILNHDVDMNFPAQVSAFFTALKKEIQVASPALIICSENRFLKWLYHLKIYGNFTVHCPKECISEDIKEGIIMTSIHQTKVLQNLVERNFSFIVIEEFDLVSNKRIFKQLRGDFHIGLTTHNFIKEPNQKVFFEMINWTNPGVLGKFSQFCKDNIEHLQNFRWPYEKYWHRLTWNFCDTFTRPTVEEKKEYVERIKLWAKQEKVEINLSMHENIPKKRKYKKTQTKTEQKEMQKAPFTSSDSSNDVVETLGKKTNIRRKKRKVTPNKHVKEKPEA
ncbi:switch 2 [Agrilus planipennis]|uniref:Switch 2 n=1 Tax=Agrilus planipennis TaxID=224129 RepID=A0A1W4X286_AGRPL|nr:switch 2 [Agrilus planipennis]